MLTFFRINLWIPAVGKNKQIYFASVMWTDATTFLILSNLILPEE